VDYLDNFTELVQSRNFKSQVFDFGSFKAVRINIKNLKRAREIVRGMEQNRSAQCKAKNLNENTQTIIRSNVFEFLAFFDKKAIRDEVIAAIKSLGNIEIGVVNDSLNICGKYNKSRPYPSSDAYSSALYYLDIRSGEYYFVSLDTNYFTKEWNDANFSNAYEAYLKHLDNI
jgi:hypothetical protein